MYVRFVVLTNYLTMTEPLEQEDAARRMSDFRDFVPWCFFDAGQLSLPSVSSLPACKNQHNNASQFAGVRASVQSLSLLLRAQDRLGDASK
jgi:hypothetical protein